MSNIFEGLKVIDCGSFIAAPAVGEHSDQILREIGYDETVIAKLRESRIVA